MAKEAASRGFPCPPDVEADLAQRLECWGKGRDYIIALEGRHDRKRANIAILSRNGKAAKLGRSGKGGPGAMSDGGSARVSRVGFGVSPKQSFSDVRKQACTPAWQ